MKKDTLESLFQRFRADDDVLALAAVFDRSAPHLLALARRLGGEQAEDLLQDTYLSAMENRQAWDDSRPLMPWLLGILTHRAQRHWIEKQRQPDPQRLPERQVESPDAASMAREFQSNFEQALRSLTPSLRQAVHASLIDGQSPTQLAVNMGLRAGTVRQRLSRGLEQLRSSLKGAVLLLIGLFGLRNRGLAAVRGHVLQSASGTGSAQALAGSDTVFRLAFAGLFVAGITIGVMALSPSASDEQGLDTQPPAVDAFAQGPNANDSSADLNSPTSNSTRLAQAASHTFQVQVVREDNGDPVFGRSVELRLKDRQRPVAETDANGVAAFTLESDQIPKYVTALVTKISPQVSQYLPPKDLGRMPILTVGDGGSLSGVVLDPDGSPVPEAQVNAWTGSAHDSPADRTATTNARGEFMIEHLGAKFIVIAGKADQWVADKGLRGTLSSGDHLTGHKLTVAVPGTMQGVLLHPDGRPAVGVELKIKHSMSSFSDKNMTHDQQVTRFSAGTGLAISNDNGRFIIEGLAPRAHSLSAQLAPYHRYVGVHVLSPNEVVAQFKAGHSLAGTITDSNGQPIPNAEIAHWPFHANKNTTPYWNTCSPSDGSFQLHGISEPRSANRPFPRLLIVRAPGFAIQIIDSLPADLKTIEPLSIHLLPEKVLVGSVRHEDGTPAPGLAVRIDGDRILHDLGYSNGTPHTWEKKADCNEVRTDAEGRFRFDGLYPGLFNVQVFADEGRELYVIKSTRSGQAPLHFQFSDAELRKVVIRPIVTDALTGETIEQLKLVHWRGNTGRTHSLTRGKQGPEAIGIEPGHFSLCVESKGYVQSRHKARHYSVGTHAEAFKLFPERSLRVNCNSIDGELVRNFTVTGTGPDGWPILFSMGSSSGRGPQINIYGPEGTIHGLPAGKTHLSITCRDGEAQVDVDLTQPPERPLEVTVVPKEPEPKVPSAHKRLTIMQRRQMPEGYDQAHHDGYLYCPEHPFTIVVTRPGGLSPVRIEYGPPSLPVRADTGQSNPPVISQGIAISQELSAVGEPKRPAIQLAPRDPDMPQITLSVRWDRGGSSYSPRTWANPLIAGFRTELGPCSLRVESDFYETIDYSWTAAEGAKHTLKLLLKSP